MQFIGGIRMQALVVQAQDNPLIPFSIYETGAIRENPAIELVTPEHGGPSASLQRTSPASGSIPWCATGFCGFGTTAPWLRLDT